MPSSHRRYRDWTRERILREAASIGDDTAALVEIILRLAPASGAGVPLLHRHSPAGDALRRQAAGWRLCTVAGVGHPLIQFGRGDPEERSGQNGVRAETPQPVPREHPRPRLLPLKGQAMLTHPLAERLRGLGMAAMADAFLRTGDSRRPGATLHGPPDHLCGNRLTCTKSSSPPSSADSSTNISWT